MRIALISTEPRQPRRFEKKTNTETVVPATERFRHPPVARVDGLDRVTVGKARSAVGHDDAERHRGWARPRSATGPGHPGSG